MDKIKLRDDQWDKILPFLRAHARVYVGKETACRRFMEAALWMARTGAQWRTLPDSQGKWNSIYKRYARWCDHGVFDDLFDHFRADADMEQVMPDSTVVRPPVCRGRTGQKRGQAAQALGRSRGGFSTKLHVIVDGLGNPLRVQLTPGQAHDLSQTVELLDGCVGEYVIADRGYDSDTVHDFIIEQGATPVIPARKTRKQPREIDRHLYRERHLVECFCNKIKHYRRIFSRYDKLASRYLGFVKFLSTLIWLR